MLHNSYTFQILISGNLKHYGNNFQSADNTVTFNFCKMVKVSF